MPPTKPTVGRIVYYKSPASADGTFPQTDRAAIITDVTGGTRDGDPTLVKLTVFHPFGFQQTEWIQQGDADGNWDWMPFQKDQQLRAGYTPAGGTSPQSSSTPGS